MLCRCALVSKVDVLGGLEITENLIRDLLLFDSNNINFDNSKFCPHKTPAISTA